MIEEKSIRRKDIVVGLGAGLGVGIFVLVSVLLLLRPNEEPELYGNHVDFRDVAYGYGLSGDACLRRSFCRRRHRMVLRPRTGGCDNVRDLYRQPGDTLGEIAVEFGVSMESIQAANNIEGVTIYADQELIIYLDENAVVALTATPTEEAAGRARSPRGCGRRYVQ